MAGTKKVGPKHKPGKSKPSIGQCYWCGERFLTGNTFHPMSATREHIIPRAKGGTGRADNMATAHRLCNEKRGTHMNWIPYHVHRQLGKIVRQETSIGIRPGAIAEFG